MQIPRLYRHVGALLLTGVIGLAAGAAMASEEPEYQVVEHTDGFELRRYAPYIVAETLVEGRFDEVGNQGFRRLADYIFGGNRKRLDIDMTAPVNQQPTSEKIAMTAPVGQAAADDRWRITFTMPAEYTMATLPEPLDDRVRLRHESGGLVAAVRYSGTWSERRYAEHEARLRAWIDERGLETAGAPVFARYNSPFSLWFLRRNEVLIPVTRPAGDG